MRHECLSSFLCLAAIIMPAWRMRGSSSSSTSVPQCPATSQGMSPPTQTPGEHYSRVPPPPSPAWPTRGRTQQRITQFIPRATKKKNASLCSATRDRTKELVEDMVGLATENKRTTHETSPTEFTDVSSMCLLPVGSSLAVCIWTCS